MALPVPRFVQDTRDICCFFLGMTLGGMTSLRCDRLNTLPLIPFFALWFSFYVEAQKNKASSSSAARVLLLAAGPPHGLRSLLVFFTFVTCVWLVCAYACVVCTIVNTHTNRPMSCCVYFSHYLVSFEQDFHLVPTLFLSISLSPFYSKSETGKCPFFCLCKW